MKKLLIINLLLIHSALITIAQDKEGMEYVVKNKEDVVLYRNKAVSLKQNEEIPELARTWKRIADYYYHNGPDDSALFYYKLALKQYEQVPDSFHISYCYFRIGEETAQAGMDPDASLSWHIPAAGYFERAKEYHMAAFSNYAISTMYKQKKQEDLHRLYLDKAISYNKMAKDTLLDIIMITSGLDGLRDKNQWEELFKQAGQAVALSRLTNQPIFIKVGLLHMGNAMLGAGQPGKAIPYLEESSQVQANTGAAHPEALRLLAIAHIRLHHNEEAEKYMNLFKQASDSIGKKKDNDNYESLLVQFETEKKQTTIAALQQENLLKEIKSRNQKIFITALIAGLAILSIGAWLIIRNTRKRHRLEEKLFRQQEQFGLQLQQQKEEQMTAEFSKQLAEVQLVALSAQMNPHFIFNCMNSIQKYILKNEKTRALDFLQHFSDLMRSVLENSAKTRIGLDEEIGMLEKYILLEQQRLENKFDYKIETAPGLQTDFFEIPGMILQPYVENAIWHGLMNLPEGSKGLLTLRFNRESSFIKCMIEDNGVGRKKAMELQKEKSPRHKSYGMTIARKRLELLQHEKEQVPEIRVEDLYDKDGQAAGTRVIIFIHVD